MVSNVEVSVSIGGEYGSFHAGVTVPDFFVRAYKPLKSTDDPMLGYALGEKLEGSAACANVLKFREEVAEELARQLTRVLVRSMGGRDTLNGYEVVKDES